MLLLLVFAAIFNQNNNLEVNFTEFELPNTYEEAMNSPNSHIWKKAVVEGLQSHKK